MKMYEHYLHDNYHVESKMKYYFKLLLTSCSLLICSCASNHNLDEDPVNLLGGGISVQSSGEAKHRIVTKTNQTPWKDFGTARKMWSKAANKACDGPYDEESVNEYTYESVISPIYIPLYIVTVKEGYAKCKANEI